MMIYCILRYCIKFSINITFAYVGFKKYNFCVYLEFENGLGNDMLGNAKFDIWCTRNKMA